MPSSTSELSACPLQLLIPHGIFTDLSWSNASWVFFGPQLDVTISKVAEAIFGSSASFDLSLCSKESICRPLLCVAFADVVCIQVTQEELQKPESFTDRVSYIWWLLCEAQRMNLRCEEAGDQVQATTELVFLISQWNSNIPLTENDAFKIIKNEFSRSRLPCMTPQGSPKISIRVEGLPPPSDESFQLFLEDLTDFAGTLPKKEWSRLKLPGGGQAPIIFLVPDLIKKVVEHLEVSCEDKANFEKATQNLADQMINALIAALLSDPPLGEALKIKSLINELQAALKQDNSRFTGADRLMFQMEVQQALCNLHEGTHEELIPAEWKKRFGRLAEGMAELASQILPMREPLTLSQLLGALPIALRLQSIEERLGETGKMADRLQEISKLFVHRQKLPDDWLERISVQKLPDDWLKRISLQEGPSWSGKSIQLLLEQLFEVQEITLDETQADLVNAVLTNKHGDRSQISTINIVFENDEICQQVRTKEQSGANLRFQSGARLQLQDSEEAKPDRQEFFCREYYLAASKFGGNKRLLEVAGKGRKISGNDQWEEMKTANASFQWLPLDAPLAAFRMFRFVVVLRKDQSSDVQRHFALSRRGPLTENSEWDISVDSVLTESVREAGTKALMALADLHCQNLKPEEQLIAILDPTTLDPLPGDLSSTPLEKYFDELDHSTLRRWILPEARTVFIDRTKYQQEENPSATFGGDLGWFRTRWFEVAP